MAKSIKNYNEFVRNEERENTFLFVLGIWQKYRVLHSIEPTEGLNYQWMKAVRDL